MAKPVSASDLVIRNIGGMWRVMHGGKTLAFARDYPMAMHKSRELIKDGAPQRLAMRDAIRRANQCLN